MTTDSRRLVFLDTETTGLGPDSKPWEVAMIVRDPGVAETEAAHHHYMLDVDQTTADPYALTMSGFWERHPAYRRLDPLSGPKRLWPMVTPDSEAAECIARVTHEALIVGANPSYDMDVLARFLRANGYIPTWDYHPYDVEAVAVGWLLGTGKAADVAKAHQRWSSYRLSEACGVARPTEEDAHTAMGDAKWARDWFDALNGEHRDHSHIGGDLHGTVNARMAGTA